MASKNIICDCGRPATQRLMGQNVCQRCYDARDIVGGPTLTAGQGKAKRKKS
jgi:NMD protein affecting ribosome stability and mRNA decay